ncbi:MAG: methylenetetrahydrofolate reductase C-terminal domain-containing protein [Armatimonadetes bacterium]|nr:methylenetetrahydrofolate reductase C-terminal domain-containing protein [Armatimonadota bacterium]
MVIAERKPIAEIREMLEGYRKVLVLGCGTCVTVCMAGGEKEAAILASALRMAEPGKEFVEATVERQCDREYIDGARADAQECDAILSMACGAGVGFTAEVLEGVRVLPGLNTKSIGVTEQPGVWVERCLACGDCLLSLTGGICPIARCSKSLLNGPCGGSQNGMCEVDQKNIQCGWQLIYDRLKALGRLDLLEEIRPPKNWSAAHDGGPRRVVREDAVL